MALVKLEGNLRIQNLVNADVASDAEVGAEKLDHQYQPCYAQSGTAAAATLAMHVVQGATAVLHAVKVGSIVAAIGDSTVTVDIKKNGTTVLSGTVQLDNANTAYVVESGSLSVTTAVAGDVYTAVVTVSAGTGTLPTGLFIELKIREKAD